MKELERELSRLKKMYADLALENEAMKDLITKKALRPSEKREAVNCLHSEHNLAVKYSCGCVGFSRPVYYKKPLCRDDGAMINLLNKFVFKYPGWGFWRLFTVLRKEHWWNHKRVYRVYCAMNLNQKRRAKKCLPQRERNPLFTPSEVNSVWSVDFVSDSLYCGKKFRTFSVIDDFNREVIHIEIDSSLTSRRLIGCLNVVPPIVAPV